jgi:hypothetical protein
MFIIQTEMIGNRKELKKKMLLITFIIPNVVKMYTIYT